jgi:hypothetical protein
MDIELECPSSSDSIGEVGAGISVGTGISDTSVATGLVGMGTSVGTGNSVGVGPACRRARESTVGSSSVRVGWERVNSSVRVGTSECVKCSERWSPVVVVVAL